MADSRVSELTSATSLGGSDVFYLVQNNASKRITAATVFANASNVTLKGTVLVSGVQTLGSPGIIDLTKITTQLSSDASGGNVTLPNGTEGQLKIVVMTSTAGGTYTLQGNIANSSNVVFNSVGDSATLLYTNSKWFLIGGTATLT